MTDVDQTLLVRLRERLGIARASLRTERKHLERLLKRLDGDAAQAQGAGVLREMGEVLKVQQRNLPRGAERVVLPVPWDPPRTVEVELRRDLSPAANVERMFRRARGFELGLRGIAQRQEAAAARLVQVTALAEALAALMAEAEALPAPDPLAQRLLEKRAEVLRSGVLALRLKVDAAPEIAPEAQKVVRKAGGALPAGVELFSAPSGRPVLAGRNATANDALVTRLMRGRDLWFHVRDQTGAHVVLRADAKKPSEEADIQACAMLAAHLSGVAKGDRVEVQCVVGKHVRKVKGAPAGSVYVSEGRTLRVEVQAAVVDAFYARRAPGYLQSKLRKTVAPN